MLPEERKVLILDYINSVSAVSTTELMQKFDASEATIRRDLTEMHSKGLITKVHGGAVSNQSQIVNDKNVSERAEKNADKKIAIAKYAASLIGPSDFVFLDAGTTTAYIIDYVDVPQAVFVTNAVAHAQKLASKGYKVYLACGRLKATTEALVGSNCYEFISKFHFTLGFFGANAINHESGYTTPDPDEAKIKECAMSHTLSPYVLCDNSKFDLSAAVSFADFNKACIITSGKLPKAYEADDNIIVADVE